MIEHVDPFIGTGATDLPAPHGLAATWWWPKPQVGNTHPGASYPFGMVSACSYSGAYPTGYGLYELNTEGVPPRLHESQVASGFSHFQQSGTGAIRKYYNYFRVSPMLDPLDALGRTWDLLEEEAEPGYYATTLSSGIRCELTVGPKSAVHRYTFPAHRDARIVIDLSLGGLTIPHGATVPLRAHLHSAGPGVAQAEVVVEGAPLAVHLECDATDWRQLLWYDRRLMPGGTRLDFDRIRPTTLRPFGLMWRGPTEAGQVVELRFGFSLRGVEQARENLVADCGPGPARFEDRRAGTASAWREHLGKITVDTLSSRRRTVFETALYHSMIKPCFAPSESPFWPMNGPFVFDICTMWDIYRTQLPLITALFPDRAVELANALLYICEEEGNLPIGYRMAKGADRFSRQGSALAQTFLADLCQLGLPGVDWDWALCHMDTDLRRTYGEEFLLRGITHPVTHTLDVAFGYQCTAQVARYLGDTQLAAQFEGLATRWVNAFDPETGLLIDSTFYEGGRWNYSFRILHDMAGTDRTGRRRGTVPDPAGRVLRLRRRPGQAGRGTTQRGGTGRRLRLEPLRGPQQRARHGSPVGLPLPGSTGPDGRGRARRDQQPVRARSGRPAGQRRLGRSQCLVRLGLARAVPRGRAEPVPDQCSLVRPLPGRPGRDGNWRSTPTGFVEPEPDGPAQYVQSVTLQRQSAGAVLADRPGTACGRSAADQSRTGTERWGSADRPPSVSRPGEGPPHASSAPLPAEVTG